MHPEDREALDWVTLARLLGWGVSVVPADADLGRRRDTESLRWVVVACAPELLGQEQVRWLKSYLDTRPGMVLMRFPTGSCPADSLTGAIVQGEPLRGRTVEGIPPAGGSVSRSDSWLEARRLPVDDATSAWATLEGHPVVTMRAVGIGKLALLGFHPGAWADASPATRTLLRDLLVWGVEGPVVWCDLSGVMALRMDDPGGAQNLYNEQWTYPKLDPADWARIGREMAARGGRLSIGYVAAWVDDGDASRGGLEVAGERVARIAGATYPSPSVCYTDASGRLIDYGAEFQGLNRLCADGYASVEVHGFTHMHPDLTAWAEADDRYSNIGWFRELGAPLASLRGRPSAAVHPVRRGVEAIRRSFGPPTTLICPGDEWTEEALAVALEAGLSMVSSYHLAIREGDRFLWATHVRAPYLDAVDASEVEGCFPVVGYFHDREPSVYGPGWFPSHLEAWAEAGVTRFTDLAELARHSQVHLTCRRSDGRLEVTLARRDGEPPGPIRLGVKDGARLPSSLVARTSGGWTEAELEPTGPGTARALVAPSPA